MNKLTLLEKINIIDNVWSFNFQASEPITWVAGQFIEVQIPHGNTDAEGDKRHFTISTAPYEQIIQITTRITGSSFKKALYNIQNGESIMMIEGPMGNFVWQSSNLPTVFVIGGIGITPFLSIVRQIVHEGDRINATLMYANRTEIIPFKDEIDNWSINDPTFNVKYQTGQPLTIDRIEQTLPLIYKSFVYLSGPEPMVKALSDQLKTKGLPEEQLKIDYFENYTELNY